MRVWSSDNPPTTLITGNGEWVAELANGQPGGAAVLHIEYV